MTFEPGCLVFAARAHEMAHFPRVERFGHVSSANQNDSVIAATDAIARVRSGLAARFALADGYARRD
jgi:hypothetical protein